MSYEEQIQLMNTIINHQLQTINHLREVLDIDSEHRDTMLTWKKDGDIRPLIPRP